MIRWLLLALLLTAFNAHAVLPAGNALVIRKHTPKLTKKTVWNGEAAAASDPLTRVIVKLVDANSGAPYCTGVIYSDNLVISADHCAAVEVPTRLDFVDPATGDVVSRMSTGGLRHTAERGDDLTPYSMRFDVAAFPFEGGIPEGFAPAPPMISGKDLKRKSGRLVKYYGFGRSTLASTTPMSRTANIAVHHLNKVDDMLFTTPKGGEVCPGDSGGPVFIEDDQGRMRWLGITSYHDGKEPDDLKRDHGGCSTATHAVDMGLVSGSRNDDGSLILDSFQESADLKTHRNAPARSGDFSI